MTGEAVNQALEAESPDQQRGNGYVAAPALISQLLGLRLALDTDGILQFYRLDTGERVLSKFEAEAEQRRRQAVDAQRYAEEEGRRADEERRRAEEAEAEVARLQSELERLQSKSQ